MAREEEKGEGEERREEREEKHVVSLQSVWAQKQNTL